MRRTLVTAALAGALAAVGLVPAVTPASASDITTIQLRVEGCNGCQIIPGTFLLRPDDSIAMRWEGPRLTVRGGRASFQMPTEYTRGMSLQLRAPAASGPGDPRGGTPIALSRPRSVSGISSSVDIEDCWAGTTRSSATLRIRVVRKTTQEYAGGDTFVVLMGYLTSLPKPKQVAILQDVPWCPA